MKAKSAIFLRLTRFDAKFRQNMLKLGAFLLSYLKIGTDKVLPDILIDFSERQLYQKIYKIKKS